jgi:hypothetical protein
MTPVNHLSEATKHAGDILSAGVVLGTLFDWLPGVAALLTVLWTMLRIYETVLNIRAKRKGLSDG